jgi:hypothetical protein
MNPPNCREQAAECRKLAASPDTFPNNAASYEPQLGYARRPNGSVGDDD